MYLLDTDTLTLVHARHPRVSERQRTVPSSEIATTVITRIEILQGLRGTVPFFVTASYNNEALRPFRVSRGAGPRGDRGSGQPHSYSHDRPRFRRR